MRSYTMAKYIPRGCTPSGTIAWNDPTEDRAATDASLAAELPLAEAALKRYEADLAQRFTFGDWYDTRVLPTGEEFIEIVAGHPFSGRALCRCFSPLLAVQLFADAVERYVVQGRTSGTLYWRVHPELRQNTSKLETWDEDMQKQRKWEETYYTVRSRWLIL